MQCWQCGSEVQPGERTCGYCGARLTSPPSGRSRRSSQPQRPSSSRNGPRRSRDDWPSDDESAYGSAYPPEDRQDGHGGRRPSRAGSSGADDGWDDPRASRGRPDRGGSRAGHDDGYDSEQYDAHGQSEAGRPGYREPSRGGDRGESHGAGSDYGQSGFYDDAAPSQEHDAPGPDPLNDPRAPRNLRNAPRRGSENRGPDSRGGYPQGDSPSRYPRDDRRGRDSRDGRDDGGYRGRGYEPQGVPPLTQEGQAAGRYDDYDRYGRSSGRGQGASYDGGGYGRGSHDNYGRRQDGRGYDDYDESGDGQGRSWQQRWSETIGSMRIPGLRSPQEGDSADGTSSRRRVTTLVFLLVLAVAVVGAGIYAGPRILARLRPTAASSTLCTPAGSTAPGVVPTATANQKLFTSTRSHYGVNYPETWTVEPQQKAAAGYDYIDAFTLPNSSTLVNIEQPQAACALTDVNIIQGEVAVAQKQNITFTEVTSAATTQTIGGEQWQRREYDVTDSGVALHMVILACHHQGRAYVIVLVSRATTFKTDDSGIFEPMLKSFAFSG